MHRSPYRGFSVEFAEHREYVPGDDVRHVDWKVFGRTDRHYIKQYEEETNLIAHVVVDTSESMTFKSGRVSKLEYAGLAAASLVYLILRQRDAAGLALFGSDVYQLVQPRTHPGHFKLVVGNLAMPRVEPRTDIGAILHHLAERLKRRGLILLFSDLLDEPTRILHGLSHLRHRHHDVIVFHVLDPAERTFPYERMTRFEGLEATGQVTADPRSLRRAYLAELDRYLRALKRGCLAHRVDYRLLDTGEPLEVALRSYLAARAGEER
ncbi:MAG: DUF58 domain-containing protein [Planctomycetes bacterium]|nr:DUF58 domain-containing protein [Planctomycetota bacterium]